MGRTTVAGIVVLAVFALAGCGRDHNKSTPTTTSTGSTGTSASSTTEVSSSTTASTTTTTPPSTTTNQSGTVRISDFTVSPPSPVSCNAPTSIELKWTASLATSVELSIDGAKFATFTGGAQDHLEYFACDGKSHTYVLTARSGSATATATQVVASTSG